MNLDFDAFYNGIETSDHGYALVGFSSTYDSSTQSYNDDCWLVKTDSAGNVQAQKTYGGTEDDVAIVISEISGKRLLFSGVKKFSPTNYTPWILITDFVGNILKEKELNDPLYYHCGGGFIIPAKDDAYLFRGYMDTMINNNDAPCAAYVSKMDTNFNFVWTTIYTGAADREIWNMRQLSDSSIVFVGFTTYNLYGWIGKLDKDGNKLWEREFQHGNSGANIFADFQQTPWDKGFIITGSTVENYNQDLWLVKLDSNGMLLPDTVNTGTFEVSDERFKMQLYPNPASEETVVQYNILVSAKEAELTISDVQGRVLRTETLSPLKHTHALEVSEWAAGVYFITLKSGEDLITKKLLKQ